ncbi:MAG: FAD-dependent pyridine nucleotide-disulfide oxidoreductase [Parcubacteria group bacterium Gr01-1014_70]|nr:MAG: FAD-dependent pyridine nucleotide-disulfide oxidoreductase [Parcubacteria group bacterium Gr01-1014_70]
MPNHTRYHADYLIIGGGIAGTTAAEAIRSKDEHGSIAIISKEPYELYSRVLLPRYVEGALSREQVFLRTAEDYNKRSISLYSGEEATVVDINRKEVHTRQGAVFFYKQLLIAAGGRVKPWRAEGSEDVPYMRLHTIDDADAFVSKLLKNRAQKVVIVGGGFITLELLNAFIPRGISNIHCLIPERGYWEDYLGREEGGKFLESRLEDKGVLLHRGETVTKVGLTQEGTVEVFTTKRTSYTADMLAVGIGLDREVEPFGGGEVKVRRGIVTNEFLETGAPDVWAAGDVAEFYHPVFGRHLLIGNWNNAFLQGRIVGLNMAMQSTKIGKKQAFTHIPLYAIDVLGMHVAFLGDVSALPKGEDKRNYISRFEEGRWFERFGLEDGKLVSAVFVNKFEDKRVIERLMQNQSDSTPYIPYLSDASMVLGDVISI